MPLSKARDKERKRLARLESNSVQPKRLYPVQPKLDELRQLIKGIESVQPKPLAVSPSIKREGTSITYPEIDADGNVVPEYT